MEFEEITTRDVEAIQAWESFWDDINAETGEASKVHPGLMEREENLVATRKRLADSHKDDDRIDSWVLQNGEAFGMIGELYDGDAMYIYVHDDPKDKNPSLYVMASMEIFAGYSQTLLSNLIRVERLIVNDEVIYTKEYVLGNCTAVWVRDRKLWTMIDGVEQSIVDFSICEIDVFIVKGHESPEVVRWHSGFQVGRILPVRDPYAKCEA